MKSIDAKELQNTLIFVNGDVFKELKSLTFSEIENIDKTTKETIKNIITQILYRNVIAVNYIKVATEQKKKAQPSR